MSFRYFISSRGCAIFYHQIFRNYIHVISKQNKDKKIQNILRKKMIRKDLSKLTCNCDICIFLVA